ncbi:replicative DNA helicase [Novispirillum sp. DQ9]|uniref:replicative DNA helicase n=1 Tax=Novispirillum sp. DQ9 TaxID=3398612 RepID=UPI003C7B198A
MPPYSAPFCAEAPRRDPPHNLEAEQQLLGTILLNNRALERVSDFLRPEHFAHALHGRIFEACQKLIERGDVASVVSLRPTFEGDEALTEAGGYAYIVRLAECIITTVNAAEYGRQIHDLAMRRRLIEAAHDVIADAHEVSLERSADDVRKDLEETLFSLDQSAARDGGGFVDFSASVSAALATAEACYKARGQVTGIPTNLIDLDKKLGGLHPSDLIIVGARPGMGKTSLATNWALSAARAGKKVGIFTLEMGDDQLALRIIAAEAGVNIERVRTGLSDEEMVAMAEAGAALRELPLFIDDTAGISVATMRARAKRLARRHGLDLVIVDYIGLAAPPDQRIGKVHQIEAITMGLKNLAKELGIPVVALAQLSRAVESRDDKRPMLADLRDSGSIEQDADVVLFVYRKEYYLDREEPQRRSGENDEKLSNRKAVWMAELEECRGIAELIVDKNRHGARGTVRVRFDGATTRFSNLAYEGYGE